MERYLLTLKSGNRKTGPIPVSTTSSGTCPDACPLKASNVCYAKHGPLRIHWERTERAGLSFAAFLKAVKGIPKGQLWRHNQAGDLPGKGDALDHGRLRRLVKANEGKRGFTYTHKPLRGKGDRDAVRSAIKAGFVINLSANDLWHADRLADMKVGPVVTVLDEAWTGRSKPLATPAGRTVVVCPATYREDTTCATCGLCAVASRKVIVGFPVHGSGRRKYPQAVHPSLPGLTKLPVAR